MKIILTVSIVLLSMNIYAELKCSSHGSTVVYIPGALTPPTRKKLISTRLQEIISENPNNFDKTNQNSLVIPLTSEGACTEKIRYLINAAHPISEFYNPCEPGVIIKRFN